MRRLILGFSALAMALLLGSLTLASSSAAPPPAPSITAPAFNLTAHVAGGIKIIPGGEPLTFVFTEKNVGSTSQTEDLDVTTVTKASVVSQICVDPRGAEFHADTPFCEPGFLKPGQSSSTVIDVVVANVTSGSVSVRVCLENESTGAVGPCLTKSVII
jgi:hypothetical protein